KIIDASNLFLMGRKRLINGTVILYEDIDDSFQMEINFFTDSSGTGDFRRLAHAIPNMPVCKLINEFGSVMSSTLRYGENTNLQINGEVCPITKGTYYFNDVDINIEGWPTHLPRGLLKVIFTLRKKLQAVGDYELLLRIED
ncbi:hypothetical protein KR222_008077, partial [Zaprionus bogoriensis]